MKRSILLTSVSLLAFSFLSFGQGADPTGFCPPPGGVSACTTANGIGNETIGVGATTFIMEKNGSGTSSSPWFLLVAVPDDIGGKPTITSPSFTVGSVTDEGQFKPTTSGSIYDFVNPSLTGDGSMNASNLFGANETAAHGGTPGFFEIFEYSLTGAFDSNVAYTFNVGAPGLAAGTFLAASGVQGNGGQPFSTPFTTTGLVNGPGCTPNTCGGTPFGFVPEPMSIVLLGSISLIAGTVYRRKTRVQ